MTSTAQQPSASAPKRPKGILKNSYCNAPGEDQISPTSERTAPFSEPLEDSRPEAPPRELSERELVQMNTEANAGEHRRNSSNPHGSVSRRQSSQSGGSRSQEDNSQRLKWDEANLYLNEGQMGGRMKIDEPKTPYVGNYDPADEDDDDVSTINPQDLNVDELDMHKNRTNGVSSKMGEIPGLDIGEPEVEPEKRRESDSDKRVAVDSDYMDIDGGRHGEEPPTDMSNEEREKHKRFEEMRKKHYEMKNVKDLLGHAEDDDE